MTTMSNPPTSTGDAQSESAGTKATNNSLKRSVLTAFDGEKDPSFTYMFA